MEASALCGRHESVFYVSLGEHGPFLDDKTCFFPIRDLLSAGCVTLNLSSCSETCFVGEGALRMRAGVQFRKSLISS